MRGIEDTSVLGVGLQSGVGQLGVGYLGVRGESLDTDQLSLDLQFAADKTLTARKGPTPVFTRASSATFVGSNGLIQSAAINAARFDHDPVTLESKGLLIEESRTNLLARSAEIGNAYWTNSNLSISSDGQTSPDGGLNAETITVSAGTPSIYRAVTCTASTVYTLSFYIKIGTIIPSDFKFAVRDDTNSVFIAENITPNVTPVTTEWRRVTYTFTTPVGCVTVRPYIVRYGYISAGTFFLWGAQLEAGAFPTSYIPTTTASVIRSADVCSITGSAFSGFWNNNEGTVFASGDPRGSVSVATYLMANSGANANQVAVYRNTTTNSYGVANSGSYTANISASAANGSFNKIAGSYITNDARAAFNNVLGTPDTSVIVPTNLTRLNIGSSGTANSEFTNGCIFAIRYFRKPLSNAKLQTLTV